MIVPKDALVAGWPAREVQAVLRDLARRMSFQRDHFIANVRHRRAEALWDDIAAARLVEPNPEGQGYRVSLEGLRICNATIGKGHTRQVAQKALEGFLERCRQLDEPDCIYPYRVEAAVLFGSHARGAEVVGDVDILLKLAPRYEGERQIQAWDDFKQHRHDAGRHVEWSRIMWPYEQTVLFLRNRSRILALHNYDTDAAVLNGPHQIIYGKPSRGDKPPIGGDGYA